MTWWFGSGTSIIWFYGDSGIWQLGGPLLQTIQLLNLCQILFDAIGISGPLSTYYNQQIQFYGLSARCTLDIV